MSWCLPVGMLGVMVDAGFAGILPARRPCRRLPIVRGVKVVPLRGLHLAALRFPLVGRLCRPLLGTPGRCDFATWVPTQNIGRADNPREVRGTACRSVGPAGRPCCAGRARGAFGIHCRIICPTIMAHRTDKMYGGWTGFSNWTSVFKKWPRNGPVDLCTKKPTSVSRWL